MRIIASVVIIREVVEKEYVLIDQLLYLTTRMIFIEDLTILSHQATTILNHLFCRYLHTLEEGLFLLVLIGYGIDPSHDFFFFFIYNKPTASSLLIVD